MRPPVLIRPSWRVTYLTHRTEQVNSRKYRQVVDWVIDYYGSNRIDVMDKLDLFERSFKQGGENHRLVNLIRAWRTDWQFPPVVLTPLTETTGTVPEGDHLVRVSGVDVYGNESAASVAQTVTLGSGQNAIKVRIPRIPYSSPLFKSYTVYVDGHEEGHASLPARGLQLYPQVVITNLLGTGAAPPDPTDTVSVRWAFLRVTGYAASSREDDINNGVFTGNISLQTTVEQEHERKQVDTIQHLEVDTTILPSDSFTIVVGA
jgi:hypothetical protein